MNRSNKPCMMTLIVLAVFELGCAKNNRAIEDNMHSSEISSLVDEINSTISSDPRILKANVGIVIHPATESTVELRTYGRPLRQDKSAVSYEIIGPNHDVRQINTAIMVGVFEILNVDHPVTIVRMWKRDERGWHLDPHLGLLPSELPRLSPPSPTLIQ